jgi:uncharacterized membrane protein
MKSKNALIVMFLWIIVLLVFIFEGRSWLVCLPSILGILFFFCSYLFYRTREKKR